MNRIESERRMQIGSVAPAFSRPLTLVLACLFIGLPMEVRCQERGGQPDHPTQVAEQLDPVRVQQLIDQLGSHNFSERQSATRELWETGPGVKRYLELAVNGSNSEAKSRSQDLLRLFEMGLDSTTSPEIARKVLQFSDGNRTVRGQILRELVVDGELDVYFEILGRIKNVTECNALFRETCRLSNVIVRMAAQNNWEQVELLINHPISRRTSPEIKIYSDWVRGNLEDETASLSALIDQHYEMLGPPTVEEIADADRLSTQNSFQRQRMVVNAVPPDLSDVEQQRQVARNQLDLQIKELICRLRLLDRRDEAVTYAKMLTAKRFGFQLECELLKEQGKWDELLKMAEVIDLTPEEAGAKRERDGTPDDERGNAPTPPEGAELPVNDTNDLKRQIDMPLVEKGVLQLFAGDREGLETTIKMLKRRIELEQAQKAKAAPGVPNLPNPRAQVRLVSDFSARSALAKLYLADGRWEEAREYLETSNRMNTMNLMLYLHRYEEAFEFLGLTDDVDQRFEWFGKLATRIKDLRASKDEKKSARQLEAEISSELSLAISIIEQFEGMGLTEEAAVHAQMLERLIETPDDSPSRNRLTILEILITLHRYEDAKELLERLAPTELSQVFVTRSHLTPFKEPVANFWSMKAGLEKHFPDPLEKVKAILAILNSPMADEPMDVQRIISLADITDQDDAPVGNQQGGQASLAMAMTMKYHGQQDLYLEYLRRAAGFGNASAIELLGRRAMDNEDFASAAMIFDSSWKRHLKLYPMAMAASARERLGQTELATNLKVASYAAWERSAGLTTELAENGQVDQAIQFWQLKTFASNSSFVSNDAYRSNLNAYQVDTDPSSAMINTQIILLNTISRSSPISTAQLFKQFKLAEIRARILAKDFDEAERLAVQLNDFYPGNPEAGEVLLPMLDEAGETERANRIFQTISQFFFDTLGKYPDSPLHHNNYAWMCVTSGRKLDFSLRHAERANRLRPNNTSYLDTLAEISFQLGDRERAIDLIRQCRRLNPNKTHYRKQELKFLRDER